MRTNMKRGAAEVGYLEFGEKNISYGWHQFTAEVGYAYA